MFHMGKCQKYYFTICSALILLFVLFLSIEYIFTVQKKRESLKYLDLAGHQPEPESFAGLNSLNNEDKTIFQNDEQIKAGTDQSDPQLSKLIQEERLVIPPSNLPYNLTFPDNKDQSEGQTFAIKQLFSHKPGPYFFVECGALDGELRSNTLVLERFYNWTGLLIEGDPKSTKLVLNKHRNAYFLPRCLSTRKEVMTTTYGSYFNLGRILNNDEKVKSGDTVFNVTCLPFFAVIQSMSITEIDYFSLDVEGFELDILKTIPFDKINIKVLTVEFRHTGKRGEENGKDLLQTLMERNGYKTLFYKMDFIFVRNGFGTEKDFDIIRKREQGRVDHWAKKMAKLKMDQVSSNQYE